MKQYILNLDIKELETKIKPYIDCKYRLIQIVRWIYNKKVDSFEKFKNVPVEIRNNLSNNFFLRSLTIKNKKLYLVEKKIKYIFYSSFGGYFFSIFSSAKNKNFIYLSSQIGCSEKCFFCFFKKKTYERHLRKGEIIEQILQIENDTNKKITDILICVGEKTINFTNIISFLHSILSNKALEISGKRIILSTVFNIQFIKKLMDYDFRVKFSIDLYGTNDKQIKKIISKDFIFKIEDSLNICKHYINKTGSILIINYFILNNINDSVINARKLSKLLKRYDLINLNVKINLIVLRNYLNSKFKSSNEKTIEKFIKILRFNKINVSVKLFNFMY
jgi:23S rRNA (adenine2503-C2)-methyltransferase